MENRSRRENFHWILFCTFWILNCVNELSIQEIKLKLGFCQSQGKFPPCHPWVISGTADPHKPHDRCFGVVTEDSAWDLAHLLPSPLVLVASQGYWRLCANLCLHMALSILLWLQKKQGVILPEAGREPAWSCPAWQCWNVPCAITSAAYRCHWVQGRPPPPAPNLQRPAGSPDLSLSSNLQLPDGSSRRLASLSSVSTQTAPPSPFSSGASGSSCKHHLSMYWLIYMTLSFLVCEMVGVSGYHFYCENHRDDT